MDEFSDVDIVWNIDVIEDSLVGRLADKDDPREDIDPHHEHLRFERSISEAEMLRKEQTDSRNSKKKKKNKGAEKDMTTTMKFQNKPVLYPDIELANSKMVQCGVSGFTDGYWEDSSKNKNTDAGITDSVIDFDAINLNIDSKDEHVSKKDAHKSDISEKDKQNTEKAEEKKKSRRKSRSKSDEDGKRRRRRNKSKRSGSRSPPVPRRIACHCKHEFPVKIEYKNQSTLTDDYGEQRRKGWVWHSFYICLVTSTDHGNILCRYSPSYTFLPLTFSFGIF